MKKIKNIDDEIKIQELADCYNETFDSIPIEIEQKILQLLLKVTYKQTTQILKSKIETTTDLHRKINYMCTLQAFYYNTRQFDKCDDIISNVLKILIELRWKGIIFPQKIPRLKNRDNVLGTVKKLILCLQQNFEVYPYLGTLLGLAREGTILQNEKDIDLIIDKESFPKFKEFLIKNFGKNEARHEWSYSRYLPAIQLGLDISVYDKQSNKIFFGCDEWELKYDISVTDKLPSELHGIKVFSNFEDHLENYYGANWRKKDPTWVTYLSETIMQKSKLHCLLCKIKILKYTVEGNEIKLVESLNKFKSMYAVEAEAIGL